MGGIRTWLAWIFSLQFSCSMAQQFGGIPPALRWRQIGNDTVRVIFPAGLEKQAADVTAIVEALSKATLPTFGSRTNKINIVFQNNTTVSNGYVQLAPFRSEFQLTADQNSFELGSLPWSSQLAIHEYRHVQQYNNFRIGLSKVFYYLFGQSGQELANSVAVPNWFWEGDAVYQETLVSSQGRGRLPGFFNGYRSLWVADKQYSWMKLRNGSYRDFVPDHYPLGYMLVAYGREKYGADFWRLVTHQAAAFSSLFYPLQHGIAKEGKTNFIQFRKEAIQYFKTQVPANAASTLTGSYALKQRHFDADEEFPQFTPSGEIIYARTSYKEVHRFVLRDPRTEKDSVIKIMPPSLDNYFSYRSGRLVYSAYEPDLRWGWRDYAVLRMLDLRTGADKRLTGRSKYFSPDIDADGLRVLAVKQEADGSCRLDIINATSGKLEKSIPNRKGWYYAQPKFFDDQRVVAAIRRPNGETAIGLVKIDDGEVENLTPFGYAAVGFPSVQGDSIFFSASFHGQDQLFCWTREGLLQAALTNYNLATGNYGIQASPTRWAWSAFTAAGYRMVVAEKTALQWRPVNAELLATALTTQDIKSLEPGPRILSDSLQAAHQHATAYSPGFQLFNFHSWRPYFTDPEYTLALLGENVLGTFQTQLYGTYNTNEQSTKIGTDLIFGGWFPYINAGLNYTFGRKAYIRDKLVSWNAFQSTLGARVPLNFSRGRWTTVLQVGSDLVFEKPIYIGEYKSFVDSLGFRSFTYVDPYLNFTHSWQKAKQQIYPSLAQSLFFQYSRAISQYNAHQFLSSGYFYFPGLAATNSLVLTAAFQQKDSYDQIQFSNNFPFSRGYSVENFYRMYRLGANYHLPLAYPDWGFGNLIYFLRIRSNLFFDYTRVRDIDLSGNPYNAQFRTAGTEIFFDT